MAAFRSSAVLYNKIAELKFVSAGGARKKVDTASNLAVQVSKSNSRVSGNIIGSMIFLRHVIVMSIIV